MATTQLPLKGVFDTATGQLVGLAASGGTELSLAGTAKVFPPTAWVEPAVSPEAITVAWGPSSQAQANTEYTALGTPTYNLTTSALVAQYGPRMEFDGLVKLNVANEGLGCFLTHGLQKISGNMGLSSGGGALRFSTTAKRLIICGFPNTNFKVRILVDGCRLPGSGADGVLTSTLATTSNAPNWIDLTFPDERMRVISYEGLNLRSIFALNAAGQNVYISPPYSKRDNILIMSDSFGTRVSATGEGSFHGKLANMASRLVGLNAVNIGVGGTGWVSSQAGSQYNYKEGMEYLAATVPAYKPDYLWFYGTGNDASLESAVYPQVVDTLRSALALWPNIKGIICTGVYGGFNTEAIATRLSKLIKAGVDTIADSRIRYIPICSAETDDPMFTGAGSVPDPKGDGNADFYFSNSTQGTGDRHPNRAGVIYGADYMAKRIYQALKGPTPI